MWKLLVAEIEYNKFIILIFILFCLVCFPAVWFEVKYEHNHIPFFLMINLIAALMSIFFSKNKEINEKRERLNIQLPVSILYAGLFRFIYIFFIELIFIAFFAIYYTIFLILSPVDLIIPSVNQFLFLNGLLLLICSSFFLHHDLRKIYYYKSAHVLIISIFILIYILTLLPFFYVTDFLGLFGMQTPFQSTLMYITELLPTVILLNLIGIALSLLSLRIFINRKIYIS